MSELTNAIRQICEEKGLSYEAVVETIESALSAAYRKDYGEKNQNIKIEFDPENMKSKVFDVKIVAEDVPEEELSEPLISTENTESTEKEEDKKKTKKSKKTEETEKVAEKEKVEKVEEKKEEVKEAAGEFDEDEKRFNPRTEMQISDALLIKPDAKIGDEIKMELEPHDSYGRMAAQTAKQVIIQKLREAERDMVFNEFKDKEKEVVTGIVQRREGRFVLVDLGKSIGILPGEEQIFGEDYKTGARIKVYVKEVRVGARGAEVILSRTSDEILKKIFFLEIPEIANGLIELKGVAREAGARSKVAVMATSENVDPIGSCVGQRGARIQTIIQELGGEKIDIIEYDEDPIKFITNALSPAKVISVAINPEDKKAVVKVNENQLSLAIGKGGQNARLAARLTGWKIDIVGEQEMDNEKLKINNEKSEGKENKEEVKSEEVKSEENKLSEPLINTESTEDTEKIQEEDKKEKKVKKEKKDKVKKEKKSDEKKEEV